jgi:hypothetical protein
VSRKLLTTPTFRRSLETIGWRYVAVKGRNGSRFERVASAGERAATGEPEAVIGEAELGEAA